ncbi:MAG TPA: Holliday junction resolvase-like protein [Candidatus Nanoarchaeia archaeon]|nr:Holliday junction resolvase-like protein [Candidatus Nanoarchaeia archaeon]
MIDSTLIIVAVFILVAIVIGYVVGKKITDHAWQDQLPEIREDAIKRSRAVLGGQFSEQLAPYLPDFPYNPTEARFIGKPIDFLVFNGMDEKNISEVIFVEVKSGKSRTNPVEKTLKNAIENNKVRWAEYRVPEEITTKKTV